jgi:hypothetical protein
MTKHRISDDEADALLRGDATGVSPELAAVAESLSEFRAAAFETTPQPSAALLARLTTDAPVPARAISRKKRVRKMVSWFTGLGVLAKIILGSTVAAAAVGGAGVAGVLPGGVQDAFNTVVSVVVPATDDEPESTPTDDPSIEPTPEPIEGTESEHPDNFGGTISEWAHNPNKGDDGPFGEDVSDAAHDKNDAKEHPNGDDADDTTTNDTTTDDTTTDDTTTDDTTTDDHGGQSNGHGGNSEGNQGGKKD